MAAYLEIRTGPIVQRAEEVLHPGKTPAEYRESIGHVATDPTTWGSDLELNPDTFIWRAVYADIPCGCKVVGNGTAPYPLTILFCGKHRS